MIRSISVATPCYNETASLPDYFSKIVQVRSELATLGWAVTLLLIDDGSSDSTWSMLEDFSSRQTNVTVVRHPSNLGYGAAIKTAFSLTNTEWLVFVDSDSNYDQGLIIKLVKKLESSNFAVDVINVSILAPGGSAGYAWHRYWLSSVASLLYRLLLPGLTKGVYTLTCGFRLYRTPILPSILPLSDDFVATAEIMLRALKNKYRLAEFPASNSKREHGVSKMRFLSVVLGHLRLVARVKLGILGKPATIESHIKRLRSTQK